LPVLLCYNYSTHKKKLPGPGKACYQLCINSAQWWNMPKRFSGIITHYINSSVWSTAQQAQRITHSCCSIYTQKDHHCYRHQTVYVGDSVRNYCMAFIGKMDQNVLKIKMPFRNIFPLTGNWKYICKGKHIFFAKMSQMNNI